jgi:hypothetical protein
MHFIEEIFKKKVTGKTHDKFIRYSRGEFVGPLLNVKMTKNKLVFKGSFHYVFEFLEEIAQFTGGEEIHVKGLITKNEDLTGIFGAIHKKFVSSIKTNSLYKFKVEFDIDLKELLNKFNNCGLYLSFKTDWITIKTKTVPPKPNKEFGPDFITLNINDGELRDKFLQNYLFDIKDFTKVKEISIKHKIKINDIILPKNTDDFEEVRKNALRKGEIIRSISINRGEFEDKKKDLEV